MLSDRSLGRPSKTIAEREQLMADEIWQSELPLQVRFDEVGDSVEGWLLDKGHGPGPGDQLRGQYTIKAEDGLKIIFGRTKIDQGMMNISPGSYVRITFRGEESTTRGNTVKLFDVETKKGASMNVETGEVMTA